MIIFANVIIHIISNKVLTNKTYKYMKKIEEKKMNYLLKDSFFNGIYEYNLIRK